MKIVLIILGIIAGILFIIFILPTLLKILFWILIIGGGCFLIYKLISFFIRKAMHQREFKTAVQDKVTTWLQGSLCFADIDFNDPYNDEDDEDEDEDDDYDEDFYEDDDFDDDEDDD